MIIYKSQQNSTGLWSLNGNRAIYKPKKAIFLNISSSPFMSNCYFDNTIQAMFDLSYRIFEVMCTPSYQISDKQQQKLKQLREEKNQWVL